MLFLKIVQICIWSVTIYLFFHQDFHIISYWVLLHATASIITHHAIQFQRSCRESSKYFYQKEPRISKILEILLFYCCFWHTTTSALLSLIWMFYPLAHKSSQQMLDRLVHNSFHLQLGGLLGCISPAQTWWRTILRSSFFFLHCLWRSLF